MSPPTHPAASAAPPLSLARTRLVERLLRRPLSPPAVDGLVRLPPGARVPLSPAQARIWFFTRLFPDSAEYNVFETLRLETAPGEARLEAALRQLMERHDALRLRMVEIAGEPMQEACADLQPPLCWHDLRALPPGRAERCAKQIGDASARRPLAPEAPPLFRVSALHMPTGEAVLVFVLHHLIVDYWSTMLLLEELSALLSGAVPKPAGLRFLDYVAWQRERADEARLARELHYWLDQLGGQLPVLDLPGDRPRPAVASRKGRAVPLEIDAHLASRLERLAEREGTTRFVTLLAAYQALLLRLTGQQDLIVGTPLAGRDHPVAETLVGCFVRIVALRTKLPGEVSFRAALRRVHRTVTEAQDHQTLPYERIVAELRIPRELNYHPVFQTCFGVQSAGELRCTGAEVGGVLLESDSAKWDLTVSLTEGANGLSGFVEYASDLFDQSTVVRYAEMYVRLLAAMLDEPDRPVRQQALIGRRERDRILEGLNPYARPEHPYRTMAEPFEQQVERTPEAIALVGEEGSLTYAALNQRANRLAHFLRAAGADRGVRVALCMERSLGLVVALYAIAKSGAAYVPLDPELPDARLGFMLRDTTPLLVLVDRDTRPRIPDGSRVVPVGDRENGGSAMPSTNLACAGPTHHLVHLLYTSGSTGRPKAVAYPVDGAIADILWLQRSYPFGPGDAAVLKTSYGFDVSIWEIFWPLYFGARLVICRPGGHLDPLHLCRLMDRHPVTTLFLIPTMMQVFLDHLPAGSCRSLRWMFCGGEPVTPRIRDGFYARLGGRLINCYGPTEAGCVTDMVLEPDPGAPIVPLGRPAANFRLYVLDDRLQVAPIGIPGEVYLGGEVGVAQCYFGRPELTAERFVPDPFGAAGGRMYRTGDVCRYRDDGVLEHRGRLDRQVKVRGMRIEPAEIEEVLCEHEAVEDCVVLAIDEEAGQRLVAFVVRGDDGPFSPRELMEHTGRLLPRFMVPASIVSVRHIPSTVNGKTDRDALLRQWRDAEQVEEREVVPACGEGETKLARIFARVLGVREVSVTESFFELGGHSLLIFKLIAACSEELQVRPSVADVFSAPSVRELAERIEGSLGDPNESLVPLVPRPGKPIVVFIHAASGTALPFLEVAKRLEDFSTFGLQAPEGDPGWEDYSIASLAARYVEAVDPIRGLSPLILAGWSMGGCVAIEMARQWRERGVEVAALLMLDTWIPPAVLTSAVERQEAHTAIMGMDVLGLEGFTAAELDETPDAVARLARVLERNRDAFLGYDPASFDGEVSLLRAAEPYPDPATRLPGAYSAGDGDHGWGARIPRVVSREIAGNHFTLMAKENADALAETIREVVEARVGYTEL